MVFFIHAGKFASGSAYVMGVLEGVVEWRVAVYEQTPQLRIKQSIVITRNQIRERRCI